MKRRTLLGLATVTGIAALVASAFASRPTHIAPSRSARPRVNTSRGNINFDVAPASFSMQCTPGTHHRSDDLINVKP